MSPKYEKWNGKEVTHNGVTIKPPVGKTIPAMKLNDQVWRLNNLYHIVNQHGDLVPFKMRPAQAKFLKRIWFKNIILKARQLGFSTFIQIFMLDCALFNEDTTCMVIAHKKDDASTLLDKKIGVPYANMHSDFHERYPIKSKNKTIIEFENGSSIGVTTSGRSGTCQILHVSEMGYIAKHRPDVAEEIVIGSFPTIHGDSFIFVESTADGATGLFYDMTTKALNNQRAGKKLTKKDFRVHFFPWFDELEYRLSDEDTAIVKIPDRMAKYFAELELEQGIVLDKNQKAWYVVQEDIFEDKMKQEYPSTPEEAFEHSADGQYFSRQMIKVREEGRILEELPVQSGRIVTPYFDIGVNDPTACWFIQQCGPWFHVLGYYEETDAGMDTHIPAVKKIAADNGWILNDTWFGPHDMRQRAKGSAITLQKECEKYGANFEVVPKIKEKIVSIQIARRMLASCRFDATGPGMARQDNFPGGISRLDGYRKKWDKINGTWADKPLHDENSDGADAFQCFAMAIEGVEMKAGKRKRAQADTRYTEPTETVKFRAGTQPKRRNGRLRGHTI